MFKTCEYTSINSILFLDSMTHDDIYHSLIGPAAFDYEIKPNKVSYEAYYINGADYSKSDWEVKRKTYAK